MTHPIYVIVLDTEHDTYQINRDDSDGTDVVKFALDGTKEQFRGSLKDCLTWARTHVSDELADQFIELMAGDKAQWKEIDELYAGEPRKEH